MIGKDGTGEECFTKYEKWCIMAPKRSMVDLTGNGLMGKKEEAE